MSDKTRTFLLRMNFFQKCLTAQWLFYLKLSLIIKMFEKTEFHHFFFILKLIHTSDTRGRCAHAKSCAFMPVDRHTLKNKRKVREKWKKKFFSIPFTIYPMSYLPRKNICILIERINFRRHARRLIYAVNPLSFIIISDACIPKKSSEIVLKLHIRICTWKN